MPTADDIPIEVWARILDFVPVDQRLGMHGVNRAIFQILMDRRYETVYLRLPRNGHTSAGFDDLR